MTSEMGMMCPLRGGHDAVEAVGPGHPDKVCDQISDAILDAALAGDPKSRVALESTGKTKIKLIGEMTTASEIDLGAIAMRVHREIGYRDDEVSGVEFDVSVQSPDIALGTNDVVQGAGDQGIMNGYAVANPDHHFMPLAYAYAQALIRRLVEVRQSGTLPFLRPDCKSQVIMRFREIIRVTVAAQHLDGIGMEEFRRLIHEHVITPVCGDVSFGACIINGTGKFVEGSFAADAGLTGRKIVVDAYGPDVPVGGGAFSGKDPTKVDRSGAYMARHIAKSIVASGLALEARVKLAYTIGQRDPDALFVRTFGADPNIDFEALVRDNFPLTPGEIIEYLGLTKPQGWRYQDTAAFGHFGRPEFPWERVKQLS